MNKVPNGKIEAVARALLATTRKPKAVVIAGIDLNAWENLLPSERLFLEDAARAAILAMHSMTPAMLVAAQEAYCTSGQHGHLRTAEAPITQLVDVYHAAIDAALSEHQ